MKSGVIFGSLNSGFSTLLGDLGFVPVRLNKRRRKKKKEKVYSCFKTYVPIEGSYSAKTVGAKD